MSTPIESMQKQASLAMSYLADRGITQSQYLIHGMGSVPAEETLKQHNIRGNGYPEGTVALIFPFFDRHGEPTGFAQARFIVPEKHKHIPFIKAKEPTNVFRRAHFPRTNRVSTTLYITESYLKAVALADQGKFAVGVNGCEGWSGGKNSELLEDLWRFPWNEIETLAICWDSDIISNPRVRASACRLFHTLRFIREAEVAVRLLVVPMTAEGEKQGVDDWIKSGNADLDTLSDFSDVGINVHDSPFYDLNSKVCYVGASNVFVDLNDCVVMGERHFHTRYAPIKIDNSDGKPVGATRPWISWSDRMERGRIISKPGAPRITEDAVNVWRPSDVEPLEGDVGVHEEFLARAVPEDVERQYLKQWIGHAVQHPDVKMNVAMVFYSPEEGTGKTMTATAVGRMLGAHNVANMTIALLREQYNSAYATKQLMIVNENNKSQDSKAILEKLKTFITEKEVMVRQMHTNAYSVENYCNVILTMNHADALPMSSHDRRFMIIQFAPVLAQDLDYAEKVWIWHDQNAAALLHHYMGVDLTGFDPARAPPISEAKRELVSAAADRWTKAIIELCSDKTGLFESMGWRGDLRYITWSKLAMQLWHDAGGYTDKIGLQRDATRLGQAWSAQASHYGYDPKKCVKKLRVGGKVIQVVDLDPNAADWSAEARNKDIENPTGAKIGN